MNVPIVINSATTAGLILEQAGKYFDTTTPVGQPAVWSSPFDPEKHVITLMADPVLTNLWRVTLSSDVLGVATAAHIYSSGHVTETYNAPANWIPWFGGASFGSPR